MDILGKNIAILVLAAGASTRMGRTKQLLPWLDTTLLGHAIQNALFSKVGDVYVLLGANAAPIERKIRMGNVAFVENPNWESGMGSSIACGMRSIASQKKKYNAILITLSDQPMMDTVHLNLMAQSFLDGKKGIVATRYGIRAGVPAIFDQAYFGVLEKLSEDFGARELIQRYKNDIFTLDAGEKTRDVDTYEEYLKLYNQYGNSSSN